VNVPLAVLPSAELNSAPLGSARTGLMCTTPPGAVVTAESAKLTFAPGLTLKRE
jgi:hypothetical protein